MLFVIWRENYHKHGQHSLRRNTIKMKGDRRGYGALDLHNDTILER